MPSESLQVCQCQIFGHLSFSICFIQVGDFGLSKIKRNTMVSGGMRGTLPWMAPELLTINSNKVSDKVSCNLFHFESALLLCFCYGYIATEHYRAYCILLFEYCPCYILNKFEDGMHAWIPDGMTYLMHASSILMGNGQMPNWEKYSVSQLLPEFHRIEVQQLL